MSFWTGLLWVCLCQLGLTGLYFLFKKRLGLPAWNRFLLLAIALLPMLVWIPLPIENVSGFSTISIQLPEISLAENPSNAIHLGWEILFLPGFVMLLYSVFKILRFVQKGSFERKLDSGIRIFHHPDIKAACSFFSRIYLPEFVDETDRNWMLTHEEVHVRRAHSLDRLIFGILRGFFWFNPVIYQLDRELILNHEYEADQEVLKTNDNKTRYQQIMLAHAMGVPSHLLHCFSSYKQIKNRIHFMNTHTIKRGAYFLFVPLVGLVLTWTACNQSQREQAQEEAGEVFNAGQVDQLPEMKGGMEALMNYMQSEIHYPESMKAQGTEARVMVSFVVDTDGSITQVEAMRTEGINRAFIDEAVRAVSSMPNWQPGMNGRTPVKVQMVLPISFRL
ncbi:MAG: TonB family protein [Bacteroidetes bacterium]|nr:TonB family protein [Bacteroidota bacterium]